MLVVVGPQMDVGIDAWVGHDQWFVRRRPRRGTPQYRADRHRYRARQPARSSARARSSPETRNGDLGRKPHMEMATFPISGGEVLGELHAPYLHIRQKDFETRNEENLLSKLGRVLTPR